jgi:cardiolipin synthase
MFRAGKGLLLAAITFQYGCMSSTERAGLESDRFSANYSEAYDVYPAVGGSGVSKHLLRSHSTAILVRPVSSLYELSHRLFDQVWDTGRRLEVRLFRFPFLDSGPVPELSAESVGMDLVEWEAYLDKLCGEKSTTANLEFLIGGEIFYSALEQAIDEARFSIDLQTYLFDNDDVAESIADQLRARSEEIEVRVIYDGLGTYLSHFATAETQPENAEYIENIPRYLCKGSNVKLRVIPNIWFSGNHSKSTVFDEELAFIGGMNIGREYRYEWHDMMIQLKGSVVEQLSEDFEKTWRHNSWGGDFALMMPRTSKPAVFMDPGEVPVRLLYTLPSQAQIYRAQLEAIRRSGSYIYIENAYFADDRIIYELCRARRRGVDVRVIMPAVVNHAIMEHSNRVATNTLLNHGVRVFMYPGMTHIKAAVYDGWVCAGTANFDKLSLQINRELNLGTSHSETVQQLLEVLFEPDFKKSVEVTEPVSLDLKDHLIELIADET